MYSTRLNIDSILLSVAFIISVLYDDQAGESTVADLQHSLGLEFCHSLIDFAFQIPYSQSPTSILLTATQCGSFLIYSPNMFFTIGSTFDGTLVAAFTLSNP
jgi:hypothetical protein